MPAQSKPSEKAASATPRAAGSGAPKAKAKATPMKAALKKIMKKMEEEYSSSEEEEEEEEGISKAQPTLIYNKIENHFYFHTCLHDL